MNRTIFTEKCDFYNTQNVIKKIKPTQITLFSCDIVRSVYPIWQNRLPHDERIPYIIQTTEDYALNIVDFNYYQTARNHVTDLLDEFSDSPSYFSYYFIRHIVCNAVEILSQYSTYYYATHVVLDSCSILQNDKKQWNFIYQLYLQCFKPKHITVPKEPLFVELAQEIKDTRNFSLYNILVDAVYDYTNIKIKTKCLGLSNWLLFDLLTKNQKRG